MTSSLQRWLVCSCLVLGLYASAVRAEPFVVSDIRIEGLQRISASSVFTLLPLNIGDTSSSALLRETARALFSSGNFDDIKLARDGTVLVILVDERPSISEIAIDGNEAIESELLLDGLKSAGVAEGQVLKRSTLEGMRLELQRQYVAQGRYDSTIKAEVIEEPRNRVAVNILVNEGTVAKIKHINIVGNELYDNDKLLDQFALQTSGLFSFISGDDKYSREKLKGDLEKLESFYLDSGYIQFDIESTQVSITPDRKAVYITVNVDEGEQYTVNKVELSGDLVLPEQVMKKFVLVQKGQTFSQIQVTQTEEAISRRLGNEGYTFAKVSGIPEVNEDDKTVDIKFFVDPAKRTYVRRIQFQGNTKTRDDVLRREMRQMESAPASNRKIEQGRVRLNRTGFFKFVEVETPAVPGVDDQIDVNYTVEEQPSGSIGASAGFAQGSGLILGANIQQNNFMGTGKRVGIGANVSKFQRSINFSYVNPYYTENGVSRGFNVFFRSTDLEEGNIASYTTDAWGGNMSFGYPLSETQRLGFSIGATRTKIGIGVGAVQEIVASPRPIDGINSVIEVDDNNQQVGNPVPVTNDDFFPRDQLAPGFIDEYGDTYTNFPITASWTQSTLNRGQLATRGASQGVALELSVPGSDLEYYKLTWNGQIFAPLNRIFTLRFRGEVGYGDGYGNVDELPFYKNFFAGGFNSVRGFRANTLGPRATPAVRYNTRFVEDPSGDLINQQAYIFDEDGCQPFADLDLEDKPPNFGEAGQLECDRVFDNDFAPFGGNFLVEGSMELLFPVPFVKDQRSLRAGFFVDVGNVFGSDCGEYQPGCLEFDLADLRYSAGISLTWITGFGPLGFAIAKPFQESELDEVEVFQFSLGNVF